MLVWNVLHVAHWKYRMQKIAKNSPSAHCRTNLSGYIFTSKACIDNRKKLVKQQYLLHMFPQYGELRPTNGWDQFTSLGQISANFNGFRVLPSLLQQRWAADANQTLRDVSPSPALVDYNTFSGAVVPWKSPVMEFCPMQNSLYVQMLHSPISAVLLHGTPVAGVSQTLQHGTRNEITELSQRAPPIIGWAAITLGISPHSSCEIIKSHL